MKEIDIVIPYHPNGNLNRELRFSLRSIEKYLKNYRNIYVIGEDIPAYVNRETVNCIPFVQDITFCKERRIMSKFLFACGISEITEQFVMWNDDYFLLKNFDAANIPFYHKGNLSGAIKKMKNRIYRISLQNTFNILTERGLPTHHYDMHYPIIYDKNKFPEVMNQYDWTIRAGYVIKSLYINSIQVAGKYKHDCKIELTLSKHEILKRIAGIDLFSTAQISRAMINLLNKFYPKKSKFEVM